MNKRREKHKQRLLASSGVRVGRREIGLSRLGWFGDTLPPFTWYQIYRMLRNDTVKLGLRYLKGPIELITVHANIDEPPPPGQTCIHVTARDPRVARFVAANMDRLWDRCLDDILRCWEFGFSPGEILYEERNGLPFITGMRELPPEQVNVLVDEETDGIVGLRYQRDQSKSGQGYITTPAQWIHIIHRRSEDHYYGQSELLGAYEPWLELQGPGGAKEISRVWFFKNAGLGTIVRYPSGVTTDPATGEDIPNQDLAREMLDHIATGSSLTMPNDRSKDDKSYLWDIERAQLLGDGQHFLQFREVLEQGILRGLGITPEVVEASDSTGALAGRRVPQAAFYSSLQQPTKSIIEQIRQQIMEPLVDLVFGTEADFVITVDPLLQVQQPPMPNPMQGGGG